MNLDFLFEFEYGSVWIFWLSSLIFFLKNRLIQPALHSLVFATGTSGIILDTNFFTDFSQLFVVKNFIMHTIPLIFALLCPRMPIVWKDYPKIIGLIITVYLFYTLCSKIFFKKTVDMLYKKFNLMIFVFALLHIVFLFARKC